MLDYLLFKLSMADLLFFPTTNFRMAVIFTDLTDATLQRLVTKL